MAIYHTGENVRRRLCSIDPALVALYSIIKREDGVQLIRLGNGTSIIWQLGPYRIESYGARDGLFEVCPAINNEKICRSEETLVMGYLSLEDAVAIAEAAVSAQKDQKLDILEVTIRNIVSHPQS